MLNRNGQPVTKLSLLKAAWERGDYRKALAIAAKFPNLGLEADMIRLAHEAYAHPDFYKQLGKDIAAMQRAGVVALAHKYKLTKPVGV